MAEDRNALDNLIAKDAIRDLALLYARGVDRKDAALLRTLYTADATDTHGDSFDGTAGDYVDFLERAFPHMRYSGHHICNHLITVDGDIGEGEVYAIAWHIIPDGTGGWVEDFMCCRYIDHYRWDGDGHWRFARRVVTYDMRTQRPHGHDSDPVEPGADASYATLVSRLFQPGSRG